MTWTIDKVRDSLRRAYDGMTGQACGELADALDAHIAGMGEPAAWAATDETGSVVESLGMNKSRRFDTPLYLAPSIDLAAVREVIANLYAPGHPFMTAAANKLEAAIKGGA